jgi:EAL domain-containing protein (putative c-di-GMP-specific phosphodiesterase class I)
VIEAELRRGLDRNEFRLAFQPVLCGATGRTVGAEALLRWRHPTRGLLSPCAFLGAAERSGLVVPIGEWVVATAIAERATWPDGTFVSVNLSPVELAAATGRDLVGQVRRACGRAGVATSDVWIEVTEQPITELAPTATALRAFADLGAHVVLDDLGAGHASLARLRSLPFTVCKLDRSFVTGLAADGGGAVLEEVLRVLRTLDVTVVVEGVETAAELRELIALGCELLQGHHLAPPLAADAIASLLRSSAPVMAS